MSALTGTPAPTAKTLRTCRDALDGAIEDLFAEFNDCLAEACLVAIEAHIVGSTTVKAPVQRNSRDGKKTIKGGGTPDGWKDKPAKLCQKDRDARWLKKNGKDTCGFKMHALVDAGCKLIRSAVVTAASVHDSQVMRPLVEGAGDNESPLVFGDSACSSKEIEGLLSRKDLVSMINRKGCRHKKLSEADKLRNNLNSRTRVRVEHVYASLVNEIGGKQVRSVGLRRARVDLFLKALAYNMKQAACLLANRRPESAAA